MKLNVKAFALTCGLIAGIGVFGLTWCVIYFDGVTEEMTSLGRIFRGHSWSPMGSAIGFGWGMVEGSIGGGIFASLYNCLACCCGGKCGTGLPKMTP